MLVEVKDRRVHTGGCLGVSTVYWQCDSARTPRHVQLRLLPLLMCYKEKAEQAQEHPGIKTTINPAEDNRTKQCRPNETKPNSNAMHPRTRQYCSFCSCVAVGCRFDGTVVLPHVHV